MDGCFIAWQVLPEPINSVVSIVKALTLHAVFSVFSLMPRTALMLTFAFHCPCSLAKKDSCILLLISRQYSVLSEKDTRERVSCL